MENKTYTDGLQRTFSKDYTSILKQKVKDGHIDKYLSDTFEVEDVDANVYRLQGLLGHHAQLDAEKSDFENAKILYETYEELPPTIASEEAFWAYLTHSEYYDYVKKRWFSKDEPTATTIKRRFFYSGSAMDNALSRLWWSVFLTRDDSLEDPYLYTKVILSAGNSDLMQNFSKSRLYRLREAVHGILRFFAGYTDRRNFSAVNRHIIQYFNRYSGVKQLVYMGEDFFYDTATKALEFYKLKHTN